MTAEQLISFARGAPSLDIVDVEGLKAAAVRALQHAVDLVCNFYDTAWVYGRGHSEDMLGRLLRANPDKRLYVATKVPPKDRRWPSTQTSSHVDAEEG